MRLGFDIDDTLNNVRYKAIDIFNRELGYSVTYKEVDMHQQWSIQTAFGLTTEEQKNLWDQHVLEIYGQCKPLPYSVHQLQALHKQGHEIYFITARKDTEEIRNLTQEWLQKYHLPYTEERFFIGLKDEEKAGLVKELKLDLFFEDKPHIIHYLQQLGVDYVIKDQTYNRGIKGKRVKEWQDWVLVE